MRNDPKFGILALATYGVVIVVTLIAAVAYFYYRSEIKPGDQADADPMRRIMVGQVWVPVYTNATFFEPERLEQKEIATGSVKFRTKDPAGAVLSFYQGALQSGGFVTLTTGNAGGTVQALAKGGKESVTVTVTSSSGDPRGENTRGEIQTLLHVEAAK